MNRALAIDLLVARMLVEDPRPAPAVWLGALEPGTLCRLFVQGRWTNAQLV